MKRWMWGWFLFLSARVFAGDAGGTGAGVAEQYITFGYMNLEKYIGLCLAAESCRLTMEERTLLRAIREAMPQERKTKDQIEFRSETKEPGFFFLEGQVRIAKTFESVGSLIYVNQDLLYSKGPLGDTISISFSTAIALLIHELGHHQGEKSHLALDVLGAKVATLLKNQSQEISVSPADNNAVATAINYPQNAGNFTQILVTDGSLTLDYTDVVKRAVKCPGQDAELAYLMVWNLHWMRPYWDRKLESGYNRIPLRGQITIQCIRQDGAAVTQDQDLVIDIGFDRSTEWKLSLVNNTEKISQIDCSVKPNDCH